jgi:alpha-tubulin suppressor-like RCC1 family protein
METTSSKREVLAWGVVSHGRLGTGKPQREVEINFFGNRKLKDPKRYDSEPSIIPRLTDKNIVGISAGTDHALALSDSGEVFAWGSNSLGQCGAIDLDPLHLRRIELQRHRDRYNGTKEDKAPNLWDDVWLPRIIPQFGPSTGVVIKSVSAGGIHSAAIDRNGLVYTWGGGGNSNCLGHGEISSYEFGNSEKNDSLRRQVLAMSGHLRIPKWAIPRSIKSLKEDKISQISLGRAHCAAVSSTGSIFVWGDETMEIQKVRGRWIENE